MKRSTSIWTGFCDRPIGTLTVLSAGCRKRSVYGCNTRLRRPVSTSSAQKLHDADDALLPRAGLLPALESSASCLCVKCRWYRSWRCSPPVPTLLSFVRARPPLESAWGCQLRSFIALGILGARHPGRCSAVQLGSQGRPGWADTRECRLLITTAQKQLRWCP